MGPIKAEEEATKKELKRQMHLWQKVRFNFIALVLGQNFKGNKFVLDKMCETMIISEGKSNKKCDLHIE